MVRWAGLQCVNVVFPDYTHFLFAHKMRDWTTRTWLQEQTGLHLHPATK